METDIMDGRGPAIARIHWIAQTRPRASAIFLCILLSTVVAISRPAAADSAPSFNDLIAKIATQEARQASFQGTITEQMVDNSHPEINVKRVFRLEEQADAYRLEIEYPEVLSPVHAPGRTANEFMAYMPVQTAFDGSAMTHYVPAATTGFVSSTRTPGQTDEFPVTSLRPIWPYERLRTSEFAALIARRPGATTATRLVGPHSVELSIEAGKERCIFTFDLAKEYAITQLDMFYGGHLSDRRIFSSYIERDNQWLARHVQAEFYRASDGSLGRMMTYDLEDGWEVNKPIELSRFTLNFPEGTRVRDYLHNTTYTANYGKVLTKVLNASVAEIGSAAAPPVLGQVPATPIISRGDSPGILGWTRLMYRPALWLIGALVASLLAGLTARRANWRGRVPRSVYAAFALCCGLAVTAGAVGVYEKARYATVGPRLLLATQVVNLNMISAEEPNDFQVPFQNAGTTDLVIADVMHTCSCTAAKATKSILAPGESASIAIRYTPVPMIRNSFNTTVVIKSNDPSNPTVKLLIVGNSQPDILVAPPRPVLGTIRKGSVGIAEIKLIDPPNHALELTSNDLGAGEGFSIRRAERFKDPTGQSGLLISLAVRPEIEGPVRQRLVFKTNFARRPDVAVTVEAACNSSVNPKRSVINLPGNAADNSGVRIQLNGLAFGEAAKFRVLIEPDIVTARLAPCDFDPASSFLLVASKDVAHNALTPLSGKVTIVGGANGGDDSIIASIPFMILPAAATPRVDSGPVP